MYGNLAVPEPIEHLDKWTAYIYININEYIYINMNEYIYINNIEYIYFNNLEYAFVSNRSWYTVVMFIVKNKA